MLTHFREVDDALKEWFYEEKFDLIHMKLLMGSFTDEQWTAVYKQAYEYVTVLTSSYRSNTLDRCSDQNQESRPRRMDRTVRERLDGAFQGRIFGSKWRVREMG